MKWVAMSLNAGLIIMGLYLFNKHGAPKGDGIFIMVMLFAAPLASMVALFHTNSESWLGLYFKRKRLEEKYKIEKLDGGNS